MLLQKMGFHLFCGRIVFHCIYVTHFVIHLPAGGHSGWFHSIMDYTAINMGDAFLCQQVSSLHTDFISFGYVHNSGVARSYGSSNI